MDIVVFEIGARRSAVDLRLVQGIISLGPLTPVPLGPPALAGAMNVRGHVVPVVDPGVLLGEALPTPRPGEPSLLLELNGREVLFRAGRVEGVARSEQESALVREGLELGWSVPSTVGPVFLIDAEAVVHAVVREISKRAETLRSCLRSLTPEALSPGRREAEP